MKRCYGCKIDWYDTQTTTRCPRCAMTLGIEIPESEARATITTEGIKHDSGKEPWHLLPYDAIREVVRVLAFGAKKYKERNWEAGISYSRLYSAAIRHLTSFFQDREDTDQETGLSHLAHAICCIMFILALKIRNVENLDDRPGKI